ncbi:MAG TPA: crosslink repair DNA glycosylase YcaQ family protein [Anaerolineae bacterium]|nr:crosslink repair DNA glycosylase YcaQ family protein [Anaerolineae bacterium]
MARRYLNAYGPAAADDFARWWGTPSSQAKKAFRLLGDEIEAVDVEGWQAWALTSTLEPLRTLNAVRSIRSLPQFDAYTVGVSRDCEPVLPKKYKSRVYRPQGWISAVVLIDGRMEGTWDYDNQHARIVVKVEMFAPPTASIKRGIQTEAKRLGEFLGTETLAVS